MADSDEPNEIQRRSDVATGGFWGVTAGEFTGWLLEMIDSSGSDQIASVTFQPDFDQLEIDLVTRERFYVKVQRTR